MGILARKKLHGIVKVFMHLTSENVKFVLAFMFFCPFSLCLSGSKRTVDELEMVVVL